MFFRDIPGQNEIAERLRKSVSDQRVSHAQLFAGNEGCGNFAIALAYAQYISCQSRTEKDSCGQCPSCNKYEKLIHPDLHFVFPIFRTKKFSDPVCDNYLPDWRSFVTASPFFNLNGWLNAIDVENAQAIIYAAEASEILRKLSLKTFEAEYKIMIIWLPEKMHQTAANKLLKLIEEPPDKTLFLLVSEEPDRILPTILSRCQMIRFRGVSSSDLAGYLADKYSLQPARANEIAYVSNGNMVRATAIAKNADQSNSDLESFRVLMRHAWKRDIAALSEWSENMAATGREAQKSFLSYCLTLIRGNYIMNRNNGDTALTFMTGDESGFSEKFFPFVNERNINSLYEEFNTAHYHIGSNGNPKIIFLDLALQILKLIKA
ncbi:MAG: DNA polymerase III subunit delta [Bacteroidales bacterium]